MPQRVEKLKLAAFRGASAPAEIAFDTALPACMIFGENGTGKSCIVDAIDFVCNGKLGSLEFRRLGSGQRKERFVPCVGKRSTDVRVELAFAGVTWSATLGRGGAALCNTPDRPRAWILRRPELLGFVEAEPAERYRQLASYIAVREIEQAEAALRDANNEIDRQVGCHFNLDANIGDTDVKRLGEKVRDLANVMVCENCGELARSDKTGSDRKCRCGRVRMLPVVAPQ